MTLFGRPPTHIDSHHHVHMQPQIYPLVEAFALAHDLPLRIDREEAKRRDIALQTPAAPTRLTRDSTVK